MRVAYKTKGPRLPTPQVLRCRTLVANKSELETRVTGDEALGTTGRRKKRNVFSFPPSFRRNFTPRERETAGYEVGPYMLLSSWDDCYENESMVRETQHTENRNCFIPHRRKSRMAIHTISRPVKFKVLMSN